jgi:hypothetical protein
VKRLIDGKWTVEQTNAAVKAVLAVKPPRGYEKIFAIEKLQEMTAAGQDPTEVTRLSIRAIERARAGMNLPHRGANSNRLDLGSIAIHTREAAGC